MRSSVGQRTMAYTKGWQSQVLLVDLRTLLPVCRFQAYVNTDDKVKEWAMEIHF